MKKLGNTTVVIIICAALSFAYYMLSAKYEALATYAAPIISGFFAFVTILGYSVLQNAIAQRPQKYINMFMLVSGFKFILNLVVLLVLIVVKREQVIGTAVCFGLHYLVFLVYDTKVMLGMKAKDKE